MIRVLTLSTVLGAFGVAAQARIADHYAGEKLAPEAAITIEQAQKIALKARPGVITDRELEREGGGSGLRYSFDVRTGGVTFEVGVDAKSGKVLENDREGSHPD